MGEEITKDHFDQQDFDDFEKRLQEETDWVRKLFADRAFDNQTRKLGYELELCLVDSNGDPSRSNQRVIELSNNSLFTTELAKFNLEINGNPFEICADVISRIEQDVDDLYQQAEEAAAELDAQTGLFGVLPSLTLEHLNPDLYMTELHRYNQLSKQLISMRGEPVRLNMEGEEPLLIDKNDVMLEALATSLQIHLQVPFDEIVPSYHAALWSSMLVLGAVSNSPLILGKCCWQESRIAIFKQAVDTRSAKEIEDKIVPRVHFGKGYINSLLDLFEDNFYYSPILPEVIDSPVESLHHFSLHNGTIWRWVRPILGRSADNKYHLRLELRVVPSGPTQIDTCANIAFYLGLTEGLKLQGDILTELPFDALEKDFYAAARDGMNAKVHWIDGSQQQLKQIILQKALPLARTGLTALGIEDFERWLEIIKSRVESEKTGSNWILKHWKQHADASRLVRDYLDQARSNNPVHLWQ
jgi:gamma-glutamyl:cysteine ligase YbdK (ATP-grasp superfamily)